MAQARTHKRQIAAGRGRRTPSGGRVFPDADGQAAVEFVVLLPAMLVVLALAWQAVLAGEAAWQVRTAARAAARAHAVGGDAGAAARAHLRQGLEPALQVRTSPRGAVRVSIRIPTVLPAVRLGHVSATSHFHPQGT